MNRPLTPRGSSGHPGGHPKVLRALSCLRHRSPEEGERGWRGARVPSAGLERLLSRCLVQSEKKSAQHSYHRVQKNGKTRRAGPHQLTQGVRLRIYLQRESSADGGNTREGKRKALASKPAWGGTALCGGAGLAGPRGGPGGCEVAAGRLSDRRRSEHHGARAPRPGCAGRRGEARRAREHQGQRWWPPARGTGGARQGLGGDGRLARWRGVPKGHAQGRGGSRTGWTERARGHLSPKGVRGEGVPGVVLPSARWWDHGEGDGAAEPSGAAGSSPGASSGMCK